ncbi:MAG: hypothetical protein ABIZ34_06340 [Candidatus Limnocylindrales bacterium]
MIATAVVLLSLLAGCGGAAPSAGTSTDPSDQVVDVRLTDGLRIELDTATIRTGRPVAFRVTNKGASDHEFYLGTASEQAAHATEMAQMGAMMHDDEHGVGVSPGETKTLMRTFPTPGEILAGCHVGGHYALGMVTTITILE